MERKLHAQSPLPLLIQVGVSLQVEVAAVADVEAAPGAPVAPADIDSQFPDCSR